jgi:hypothetical protein
MTFVRSNECVLYLQSLAKSNTRSRCTINDYENSRFWYSQLWLLSFLVCMHFAFVIPDAILKSREVCIGIEIISVQ